MHSFVCFVLIYFGFATVCLTTEVSKKYSAELKPLPEEGNYKASGTEYKKGGMEPLFDFAKSFIRTSLPGDMPTDFINYIRSGNFDIGGLWLQVKNNLLSYLVAIAIGLIFLVVFPVVGICFCCCRCCGKCGAKSNHEFSGSVNCRRLVLSSVLLVVATFALVGNICTYVSNERMTTGLEEIKSTAVNNLDDIDIFLNLTEAQVILLGQTNFAITKNAVISKMDSEKLTNELSDYIVETLSGGALATMDAHVREADQVFSETENAITALTAACPACNFLLSSPPFSDIQSKRSVFNAFISDHMNTKIKQVIKDQVKTSSLATDISVIKTTVDAQFNQIQTQMDNVVKKIQDFRQNTQSGFNVAYYEREVTKYSDLALKYDKYRWIFGTVLSAILTIVISLLILGVIFGFIGNTSRTVPTSRGCVSHTGSRLLMACVVCIFIFSSLLMLLTTVSFAIGAPLERYVCQGLDGPNYPLLKVLDEQSFLTGMGIKATISDVVRSCKEGKTAYVAFQLENSTSMGFNMKDIKIKLEANKQAIKNKLDTTLQSLSAVDPTGTDLAGKLTPLNKLVTSLSGITFTAVQPGIDSMKALPGIAQNDIALKAIDKLAEAMKHLEKLGNEVGGWKSDMTRSITQAQGQLSKTKMGELIASFNQDVFGIVDQYINFALDALENKLGKCSPLWNMYNSIFIVSICKYTIDAFNGFWFSMGWCLFFFMPGIIIAVKLEKYFRRMNSVGPLDDSHSSDPVMEMEHKA